MDGRFFRSFAEAEMGVIKVNTSKNKNCTCKIWWFQGKPLSLQRSIQQKGVYPFAILKIKTIITTR